eukprot:m.607218 g.607218  ORF g.607218 m.607218 type:complete len:72 (+) comp58118_c1_seq30:756-971(+)
MERKVQNLQACGKLFMDWSEDYFFVTRDIWNWDAMPPMVLGGVAVDNWLINKAGLKRVSHLRFFCSSSSDS